MMTRGERRERRAPGCNKRRTIARLRAGVVAADAVDAEAAVVQVFLRGDALLDLAAARGLVKGVVKVVSSCSIAAAA